MPRFLPPGGPICPNCTLNRSRKSVMRGPVPDPSGKTKELVFVCDRCKWTMPDRRQVQREESGKG